VEADERALLEKLTASHLDEAPPNSTIKKMQHKQLSNRDAAFWRAYTEILNERVSLVDHWDNGTVTWHPRVVQKLVWYSKMPDTMRNRSLAYDWLMQHCARFV
jgi:hypothetical protein